MKNPRNRTEKLPFRKYVPVLRKHVEFKEAKIKLSRRPGDWPQLRQTRNGQYLCGGGPFAFRMIRCGRRFESLPSRYLTCREGQGAVRQVGVGKDVDLGAADAFSAPYAAILLQIGASPASRSEESRLGKKGGRTGRTR